MNKWRIIAYAMLFGAVGVVQGAATDLDRFLLGDASAFAGFFFPFLLTTVLYVVAMLILWKTVPK